MFNHITQFEGDAAACATWLPFAKTKGEQLPDGAQASYIPDPGILIRVRRDRDDVRIYIKAALCVHTLDTGYVNTFGAFEGSDTQFTDGELHATETVEEYLAGEGPFRYGRLQGTTANTIAPAIAPRARCLEALSESARHLLFLKKRTLANVPPSTFPGKLRLFMQAQYGAWLDQKKTFPWTPVGFSQVSNNGLVMGPETGHGLFTTDARDYFLVHLPDNDSPTIYPIKLDECARRLRDWLVTNQGESSPLNVKLSREDVEKVEAYILARARVDTDNAVTFPDVTCPERFPLAYAWKFRWDGHEADIIDVAEVNLGGSTCKQWRCTHLRAVLSRDSTPELTEAERWRFRFDTLGESTFRPASIAHIWAPNWTPNTLQWMDTTGHTGTAGSGGPFYCYYDANDELQTFSFEYSTTPVNLNDANTSCETSLYFAAYPGRSVTIFPDQDITRTDAILTGGGASADGYTTTWSNNTTIHAVGASTRVGNPFAAVTPPITPTAGCDNSEDAETVQGLLNQWAKTFSPGVPYDYWHAIRYTYATCSTEGWTGPFTRGSYPAMVIPFGECEGAYFVTCAFEEFAGLYQTAQYPERIIKTAYWFKPQSESPGFNIEPATGDPDGEVTNPYFFAGAAVYQYQENQKWNTIDVTAATFVGGRLAEPISFDPHGTPLENQGLFFPTTAYPYSDSRCKTSMSLNGEVFGDVFDNPDFTTFVGWA